MHAVLVALAALSQAPGQTPAGVSQPSPAAGWRVTVTSGTQVLRLNLASDADATIAAGCSVVVGPLGPTPPSPPAPPGPFVPPPPAPVDPLKAKVAAAFKADAPTDQASAAAKRLDAISLQGLYLAAVDGKLAEDPTLTTVGDLLERVRKVGNTLAAGKLAGTRQAIAEELAAVLKSTTAPLTETSRKAAHDSFVRIAAALNAVVE